MGELACVVIVDIATGAPIAVSCVVIVVDSISVVDKLESIILLL